MAAVSQAMMFSGVYPLVPYAVRRAQRAPRAPLRSMLGDWAMAMTLSAARPAGVLPLPGAHPRGPRPIIVLHGYAMNRANFVPLAYRLSRAGLGPILGFEYWTLGRIAAAARRLGWFIDQVRAASGATEVDVIGHSMGGVVASYYVTLAGGDGAIRNLVTIGSPHGGTDLSVASIGHPTRELITGSKLLARIAAAPPPRITRVLEILSRSDALVPADSQAPVPGRDRIVYDDLGHVALLGSRRVASVLIAHLAPGP